MLQTGTQAETERLESLVTIARQKHIRLIKPSDVDVVAKLCEKCHFHNGFDGHFDIDATKGTIQAIRDKEEHLAIMWKEEDKIIGVGLFLLTPSITSVTHKKVYEVAWDVDPEIGGFKKGRIMVGLLNFMLEYYKNIADTAHFSIPFKNSPLRRYLVHRDFTPKEVCYVKELSG